MHGWRIIIFLGNKTLHTQKYVIHAQISVWQKHKFQQGEAQNYSFQIVLRCIYVMAGALIYEP